MNARMTPSMPTSTRTKRMRSQPGRMVLASLAVAGLACGCGLTAPSRADGYADLESLGMFDVDNKLTISIGPALLRFAAMEVEDDPETRALLQGLKGVRVRIYEIDGNPRRVAARLARMSSHLQEDGWMPLMLVRERNEAVHLLVKSRGDAIQGLTLLVSDGESEAVVVNLIGDIRPERFSDAMIALDLGVAEGQTIRVAEG